MDTADKYLEKQRRKVLNSDLNGRSREAKDITIARAFKKYNEQVQATEAAKVRVHTRRLFEMGAEEAAKELDQHCQYCGALLTPKFISAMDNRLLMIWPDCGCPQGVAAVERVAVDKQQAHLDAQMQLYQARMDKAGLNGWLNRATFNNYKPRPDFPGGDTCKRLVMEYSGKFLNDELQRRDYHVPSGEMNFGEAISDYNLHVTRDIPKSWLVLYGNFGNGKSHLAAAVVRAAIDAGRQNIYFRVWPEYLERLKATFGKDDNQQSQAEIIAELRDGDLVVIDDLDKSQPTEWVKTVLYTALNFRYNEGLPTVLTFNYSPTDVSPKNAGRLALEDYLGRAVIDRIIEVSTFVEFSGPSFRSKLEWSA